MSTTHSVLFDVSLYQRLFGDDRREPVQVQAFENHQSHHAGSTVVFCNMWRPLWVNETDGGAGANVLFKAMNWSII